MPWSMAGIRRCIGRDPTAAPGIVPHAVRSNERATPKGGLFVHGAGLAFAHAPREPALCGYCPREPLRSPSGRSANKHPNEKATPKGGLFVHRAGLAFVHAPREP